MNVDPTEDLDETADDVQMNGNLRHDSETPLTGRARKSKLIDEDQTIMVEFGKTGHYPCLKKDETLVKVRKVDLLRDSLDGNPDESMAEDSLRKAIVEGKLPRQMFAQVADTGELIDVEYDEV